MAFRFFGNIVNSNLPNTPNDMYREQQQAFIDMQWENTSARFTVEEQDDIGVDTYTDIEVWIDSEVGDTTTGQKVSADFLKFIFSSIDHSVERGLLYQFNNNYWMVHNHNFYNGLTQSCGVRRCNNYLKIIDPLNGSIRSFPCIVEYDMSSPTPQVTRYVSTPNNHAVVMVQGNTDTNRLFTTNTRVMLGGRPFKLYGFQNAIYDNADSTLPTLIYMDFYLDEKRANDNIETGIADNGNYLYSLGLNATSLTLPQNSIGTLEAIVTLNGEEVNRNVNWVSSDASVVSIDESGNYSVNGGSGNTATVTASLSGNGGVVGTCVFTVGDVGDELVVSLNPVFDSIRQYQTVPFGISVFYNGVDVSENCAFAINTQSTIFNIQGENNSYTLSSSGYSASLQFIEVEVTCSSPQISVNKSFEITALSMMG